MLGTRKTCQIIVAGGEQVPSAPSSHCRTAAEGGQPALLLDALVGRGSLDQALPRPTQGQPGPGCRASPLPSPTEVAGLGRSALGNRPQRLSRAPPVPRGRVRPARRRRRRRAGRRQASPARRAAGATRRSGGTTTERRRKGRGRTATKSKRERRSRERRRRRRRRRSRHDGSRSARPTPGAKVRKGTFWRKVNIFRRSGSYSQHSTAAPSSVPELLR